MRLHTRRTAIVGLSALIAGLGTVGTAGGGGGDRGSEGSMLDSIGSTAPEVRISNVRMRDYYKLRRSQIEKMLKQNLNGTKKHRLEGFSDWGTTIILNASLIDSNGARALVKAMDKLEKREHRKKFLKDEVARQNKKVKELSKTARKLRRDASEAFKTSGESDRAVSYTHLRAHETF